MNSNSTETLITDLLCNKGSTSASQVVLIILFIVTEILPFLPCSQSGILHSIVLVLQKFISKSTAASASHT